MSTHSRLAPSSAHRWMMCGQSVVPVVGGGIEEDSDASREGTAAHILGELCLENDKDASGYVGKMLDHSGFIIPKPEADKFCIEITAEMAARVQVRLDYVRAMGGRRFTELKLTAPEFHPDFGGTIDDLILEGFMAFVIDYKDGFIHVEVERNPQLMSYAWGVALKHPEIRIFELIIIQPKNEANPIRSWEISREELELWAYLELLPAMEKAGAGEYVMGDHCKYCPRLKALQCPAHSEMVNVFANIVPLTPEYMPAEQLAKTKENLEVIERFAKAVDNELSRRLLTLGQEVPGWKVVEKVSGRIWKDASTLSLAAPEEFFSKPELMSPAKVEKLPGGSRFVAEFAYKPKTGLTIAKSDNKRLAVSAIEVYKDVV